MTERSIVPDCKSGGLVPTGVRIPPCAQLCRSSSMAEQHFCKVKVGGSTPLSGSLAHAHVAQVAEHILGKNEVRSASLRVGSQFRGV